MLVLRFTKVLLPDFFFFCVPLCTEIFWIFDFHIHASTFITFRDRVVHRLGRACHEPPLVPIATPLVSSHDLSIVNGATTATTKKSSVAARTSPSTESARALLSTTPRKAGSCEDAAGGIFYFFAYHSVRKYCYFKVFFCFHRNTQILIKIADKVVYRLLRACTRKTAVDLCVQQ